jgi:hypothetical protein
MAMLLTGKILRLWRAFGRVRFTVRWDGGETATITVPKRQIDATLRAGDRVGTIEPGLLYDAEDLLEGMAIEGMPEGEEKHRRQMAMHGRLAQRWEAQGRPEQDSPWNKRYYQRA